VTDAPPERSNVTHLQIGERKNAENEENQRKKEKEKMVG
jgi:hypothetical protein